MRAITPYRHLFDIDPWFPLFPGENELRSLGSDIMPGGFRLDVEEKDDAYVVTSELAGVDKGDIDIQFEDERLTISIDHKESEEKKDRNYIHKETREWSATRAVMFHDVDDSAITAKLDNGVLTISLPKVAEEVKPTNKVTIE